MPISDFAVLNLDAPTVPPYAIPHETGVAWGVWCRYCDCWHSHGIGEGHRESHCKELTPYSRNGYNLAYAGDVGPWYPGPQD